jgi:hypothetical protein
MAFKLSFLQLRLLESLPLTEHEFEKNNLNMRKVLWANDLIAKDDYDGQLWIVVSKNGREFLKFNGVDV